MNAPTDEQPDPKIDERYRRASAAEAGKPSEATRAAILREARLEAMRRTPAANESSWKIRAVAGIAVVGLASLILFEANRQGHSPVPQAPVPTEALATADQLAATNAPQEIAAPAKSRREADAKPRRRADSVAAVQAPVPPSARAPEMTADEQIEPTSVAAVAPAPVPAATPTPANDDQALFARSFPEVFASQSPPRVMWLVQDDRGHILRRGELPSEQTLEMDEVARHVAKGLQVKHRHVVTVATEPGAPVQLLIIVAVP